MNNFLKLVHFELKRFSKLYMSLMAIIAVVQLWIVFFITSSHMKMVNTLLAEGKSVAQVFEQTGRISLIDMLNNPFYLMTIMIGAIALMIYLFFIWYREWFGKSSFIYRLLMLPTNRMNLFYSKAVAILLFIFGLLAVQLILMHIEQWIIHAMVPQNYTSNLDFLLLIEGSPLAIVLPATLSQLFINYGVGIMVLVTLFTAILLERSFRMRGVVMAIIYCVVAGLIFLIPGFVHVGTKGYFYYKEILYALIISGLLVTLLGLLLSNYLLKRKITV